MERIQAAIAKARAERRTAPPPDPAAAAAADQPLLPFVGLQPAQPAAEVVAEAAVAARWAALTPVVPNAKLLARHRIITATGGRDTVPFDVMRTRLLQQMRANNWRRLAITSPTAACGKSTIALNLAFGLARQADTRSILCELDLRRPSLSAMVGMPDTLAFSQVIAGRQAFGDNARRVGSNLAMALNHSPVRNPAELLHGNGVAQVLDRIETEYNPRIMIFDLPPLLVSDDAMAFMGHVDCVLVVAAAEATTIKQVDQCERELAGQTTVLGVVLNKCRYTGPDYGYDYY